MLPNTSDITKKIYTILDQIEGLTVTLTMPENTMTFPIAVITPPISTGYMLQQHFNMRFSVEVWNDTQYGTMEIADKIKEKMIENDIGLRSDTSIYQDPITKKYRITCNFECRYNCITNTLEPNF